MKKIDKNTESSCKTLNFDLVELIAKDDTCQGEEREKGLTGNYQRSDPERIQRVKRFMSEEVSFVGSEQNLIQEIWNSIESEG